MDKNKPMMIIIIALLILLLGTVVAVTFYLVSAFGSDNEVDGPRPGANNRLMPYQIQWRELDEIRTNLLEPPPGRQSVFVIASFMVGVNDTAPNRELSQFDLAFNYSVARSIANEELYRTTYTEARTPEGRAAIEARILSRLQLQFGPLVVDFISRDWAIS